MHAVPCTSPDHRKRPRTGCLGASPGIQPRPGCPRKIHSGPGADVINVHAHKDAPHAVPLLPPIHRFQQPRRPGLSPSPSPARQAAPPQLQCPPSVYTGASGRLAPRYQWRNPRPPNQPADSLTVVVARWITKAVGRKRPPSPKVLTASRPLDRSVGGTTVSS